MFKNYFITAFRNLGRNKIFSAINIFGLTIGLTSCLLIGVYISHELSYDDFQQKGNRIARVIMEYSFDGSPESNKGNFTSTKVAPTFKRNFPEVESAVRMTRYERVVRYGDKTFMEPAVMFADSSFFDLFTFSPAAANMKKMLDGPFKVILTSSTAKKYFGIADPIGKIISIGSDSGSYLVTGVMPDCPSNSQVKFDFLASFSSLGENQEETYWDANYTTYLLLKNKSSISTLQQKLPAFMKKEMEGKGATVNFFLEPFLQIHLHSLYTGFEPNNSILYIYILAAVVLLILLIAGFTYINLSTARSMERAKEVGVRKVIGALRSQLFWQFIGESFIVCSFSFLLSLLMAYLLMPYFNVLAERQLPPSALLTPAFLLFGIIVTLLVSFFGGFYPSLILSKMLPVKVLKGAFKNTGSGHTIRKSLIVFQFGISVFLLVSTVIIQRQMHYIRSKKLGYDRDHIIVLNMDQKMQERFSMIKNELKSDPSIINITHCQRSPVNIDGGYNMRSSTMNENEQIAVTADPVEEDFIKTTGLQLVAGDDFTAQDMKDVSGNDKSQKKYHFILNESAASQLGWTSQTAVGKKMFLDNSRPGVVRGVVKNFHFESLHHAIKPLVLFVQPWGKNMLVKIKGNNISGTIATLASKWKVLVPYMPFQYRFMDEDFNKLYNSDARLEKVLNIFSAIAIILACLGLLGLSSYAAKQRTKEIGIRKVLGANSFGIAALLSRDFLQLVFISILVASPLAWWAMHLWLQDFSYRINIGWPMFLATGFITLLIAALTTGLQSIRTAGKNVLTSLRSE